MYKTEKEIFSQYEALKKTYDYMMAKREEIEKFVEEIDFKSVTFIGCGSSYSISKSAAISARMRVGKPANAIAAGDLMVNFDMYKGILKDTLLVTSSRSGNTSEVVNSIKLVKEKLQTSCISICTSENSSISGLADLNLEMPWAFDESVCQTRTVTNLYMADLILIGIISNDNSLFDDISLAIANGEKYIQSYTGILKEIAQKSLWNKVVMLADAELEGIAEEGALAFNEICQLSSNYYHITDVRHGPMVLVNDKTLVIIAVSPAEDSYQADLIHDLKKKKAVVITVSDKAENVWDADFNVSINHYGNLCVAGIPFIFVSQIVSYYKAIALGVNPDEPQGLDPWIKL
jgi:glutamine---fructose-6-phosphate transaminase (isomerizing)